MSLDFINVVSVLAADEAQRLASLIAGATVVAEPIVSHDGLALFDPRSSDPYPRTRMARALRGRPVARDELGAAYVDLQRDRDGLSMQRFEASNKSGSFTFSAGFPALAAVDRAIAIPNAVSLMRGRAFMRLGAKAVARLQTELPALVARAGRDACRAIVAGYLRRGDGRREAAELLALIEASLATAAATRQHVVLLSCTPP